MAATKQSSKPAAAGASAPVAVVVPDPAPAVAPAVDLKPADEAAALEDRIAADQARLAELRRKRDFVEFPKMVKGHIFNTRADQDAAGPEYQDA